MGIKLGNFFEGNELTITQVGHGVNQNFKAFDFIKSPNDAGRLIAPWDGEVRNMTNKGKLSYFRFHLEDKSSIEFVHSLPTKIGKYKKGDYLGDCMWDHHHVSIDVVSTGFDWILNYMDRKLKIKCGIVNGQTVPAKWGRWSTYPDKYLNIKDNTMLEDALKWNDLIGEKKLCNNTVTFKGDGKFSKLVNRRTDKKDRILTYTYDYMMKLRDEGLIDDETKLILRRLGQYASNSTELAKIK